jgi:hypothetical protein
MKVKQPKLPTLLGTRVLVTKPIKPESTIVLSPEMEAELEIEMMKKWTHIEIYAIGDEVKTVKIGDIVYIPIYALKSADLLEMDDLTTKMMVAERDIAMIW